MQIQSLRSVMLHGEQFDCFSHPSCRSDEWILEQVIGRRPGTFLEIGTSGLCFSDTYALERQMRWEGYMLATNKKDYLEAVQLRPLVGHDYLQQVEEGVGLVWKVLRVGIVQEHLSDWFKRHQFDIIVSHMHLHLSQYVATNPLPEIIVIPFDFKMDLLRDQRAHLEPLGYELAMLRGWQACYRRLV